MSELSTFPIWWETSEPLWFPHLFPSISTTGQQEPKRSRNLSLLCLRVSVGPSKRLAHSLMGAAANGFTVGTQEYALAFTQISLLVLMSSIPSLTEHWSSKYSLKCLCLKNELDTFLFRSIIYPLSPLPPSTGFLHSSHSQNLTLEREWARQFLWVSENAYWIRDLE